VAAEEADAHAVAGRPAGDAGAYRVDAAYDLVAGDAAGGAE
jgi:hypothetical protein